MKKTFWIKGISVLMAIALMSGCNSAAKEFAAEYLDLIEQIEEASEDAEDCSDEGDYDGAIDAFEEGIELIEEVLDMEPPKKYQDIWKENCEGFELAMEMLELSIEVVEVAQDGDYEKWQKLAAEVEELAEEMEEYEDVVDDFEDMMKDLLK